MKEWVIPFLIALCVGAAINQMGGFSWGPAPAPKQEDASQQEPGNGSGAEGGLVSELSQTDFDNAVLGSDKPVMVDFYATWCGPCKQMAPVIEKLAGSYKDRVKFYKVDVDANSAVAAKYNVNSIPTFIFFKNGKRVDSYTGAVPRESLAALLDKQLTQ